MAHTSIQAVWSGAPGLPGYTRFRWAGELTAAEATAAAAAMRGMFAALASYIPAAVSITWDGIATHHSTNGQASGVVSYTVPDPVAGTFNGGYSAAVGAVVNWSTGLYVNGRRLRGRTFLVPLAGPFDNNGTLTPYGPGAIADAAAAVATSATGMIVHGGSASAGWVEGAVTGVSVPDRVAVLRSRRD